jgi:proteasome lid subunit RPN8/RPN11
LTISLSREQLERIVLHCKEACPAEACGILIGTTSGDLKTVTEAWPANNALASESSYEIPPETLFRAFTYAEQNGLEVLGFYHSHPSWPAEPSAVDRAQANYPGLSYLIYSIQNNEIESYHFDGRQMALESVELTSSQQST